MNQSLKALAGAIVIMAGSTAAMGQTNVFPDDGKVGIGRTNPDAKLHVKKNANTLALEGSDHSYMEWFPRGLNSGRKGWMGYGQQNNETITLRNEFQNGNIVLMTSLGNIGVNTLEPMAALHVQRNAETMLLEGQGHTFLGLYPYGISSGRQGWMGYGENGSTNLTLANETDGAVILRSNGGVGVGTNDPAMELHVKGNAGVLGLEGDNHVYMEFYPRLASNGRMGWVGYGDFGVKDLSLANEFDGGAILLRSDAGVGIGTTEPEAELDVNGLTLTNELAAEFVYVDGAIGINQLEPRAPLHIDKNGMGLVLEGHGSALMGFYHRGYPADGSAVRSGWVGYGSGTGHGMSINNEILYGHILLRPGDRGKVGINTTSPEYMLDVCGTIRGKEVIVEADWCDYVFEEDYDLMSINELEAYLKANKHLPNIPPASEIETNGLQVSAVNQKMMEKIEELTLYIIQQNHRIEALESELNELKDAK